MSPTFTTALVPKHPLSEESVFSQQFKLIHNFECADLAENDILVNVEACSLREEDKKDVKNLKLFSEVSVGREVSGKIAKVGKGVTRFQEGEDVVGIIPLDVKTSGCAKICVLCQYDVVPKPSNVKCSDAVSILRDAVKAYTAFYYLGKIQNGDTILLFNAESSFGLIVIQLAKIVGAKVVAAVDSDRGLNLLRRHQSATVQVIDTRLKKKSLVDYCMDETGGVGIDCVIDNGVEMYLNSVEDDDDLISFDDASKACRLPSKHDVISTLAVGGRWITSQSNLQLDPPDSQLLFLKCSSLHFLFEDSWTLSRNFQGKYLHILEDIMSRLSQDILKPADYEVVRLDDCPKALEIIDTMKERKAVVQTS